MYPFKIKKWLWIVLCLNTGGLSAGDTQADQEEGSARGAQLYRDGDTNKHILACINCHGPHGKGDKEAGFPVLAGQNTRYLVQQLQAYKQGKRHTDALAVMRTICASMSTEDMQAVAEYLEKLE